VLFRSGGGRVASRVVRLNDLTFHEWTGKQPGVTVVAVTAAWCAQSRELEPIMEAVGTKFSGKARLASIDFDESTEFAKTFEITGVPSVMIFRQGKVVDVLRACSQALTERVEEFVQRAV